MKNLFNAINILNRLQELRAWLYVKSRNTEFIRSYRCAMGSTYEEIGLSTLMPSTDDKGAVGSDIFWHFFSFKFKSHGKRKKERMRKWKRSDEWFSITVCFSFYNLIVIDVWITLKNLTRGDILVLEQSETQVY